MNSHHWWWAIEDRDPEAFAELVSRVTGAVAHGRHDATDPMDASLFGQAMSALSALLGVVTTRSEDLDHDDSFGAGSEALAESFYTLDRAADEWSGSNPFITGDLLTQARTIASVVSNMAMIVGSRAAASMISEHDEFAHTAGRASALVGVIDDYRPIKISERTQLEARAAELEAKARAQAEVTAKYEAALAAQTELSAQFTSLSKSEATAATNFRRGVIVTLVGVAALATFATFENAPTELSDSVSHVALTVPLLVLAGYLAREASQHRKLARWSSVLAVQLRTIANFVRPLEQDQQRQIVAVFGSRVFGELPQDMGGKDDDGVSTPLSVLRDAMPSGRSS